RRAPLAHVARDLGEADQGPGLVADRIDHDVGPEQAAVLAHAPTFGLVAALLDRGLQRARGQAGGALAVGVEPGEVLADDLLGVVALDARGARVPAGDDAVGIE